MKIKIVLYKSKTNKKGEHPIMLWIAEGDKRTLASIKYIGEGLYCDPEYWDDEYGILEGYKHPKFNRSEINNFLGSLRIRIEDIERDMSHKGKAFTIEQVIREVLKKEKRKVINNVIETFNERIEYFKERSAGNAKVYKDSRDYLIRFIKFTDQKPERIRFADIGVNFLNTYEAYLTKEKYSSYTRSIFMRTLRAVFNYAIMQGYISSDIYPFGDKNRGKFSISKGTRIKVNRYIDYKKILEIYHLKLTDPGQIFARDIFMFSFFSAGMAFTDIARLTMDKIQDDTIVYSRKKLKQSADQEKGILNIALTDQAKAIISKYKNKCEYPYLFPILNKSHKTEQQIFDRIHKVLGQVNKSLKEIGEKMELSEELTSYIARHSFAVYLYDTTKDINLVKDMLGHSSITTTTHYLETLGKMKRDKTTKNLFKLFE